MKKTTNTTTARTAEEIRAERRANATTAFNELIRANRAKDWYFSELYQELLYNDAERAVYIALRARHEKSGLQFLADLQNAQTADRTARNSYLIAEQMTALEQMHESHRKGYEFFNARANRVTLSDYERALAYVLAEDFHAKAEAEQADVNNLYDVLDITLSDRADLTQTAILKMLELEQTPAPITATILANYGAEAEEDLTEEERAEAQASANFRAVINAVGRAISTLTTPTALNRNTTKAEPITAEEVANYILKYGADVLNGLKIPHTTKRTSASQCYITIEERNTKTQQGYYKVTHYVTVAPYQYIEDYSTTDENGENDVAYIKTYNPFISNYADIERIEDLCNRSNLTDRQREFLEAFARRCRVSADFRDCKKYAFAKIGIASDRTQRDFFAKLKKALQADAPTIKADRRHTDRTN